MIVHGNQDMLMVFTVQDITVEKATEKKLAELKQEVQVKGFEYQQAEVLASMSSWLWDTESGEITWSEGAYQLLGYKPGTINLSQKHLLRAVHPDDQKRVTDELALAIKEGTESRLQFSLIRSGEVRRVAATFKLMPYEGRKLFLGILQDITVQYNLEQKLLHQAQLATSISENMLDRAVITDTENTIQLWNRTCEEIYGIKKDAAIGNNFFDVFPQLKNEEDLSLFNRALSGETISIKRTRGSLRREYHDLYMVPLMDDEGTVTGVLHILHDVSREVEIEQKLTERVNFIESLVEASVDRIIVMDRHMNYLYCNQKAADNYGLSKEELIGKNVLEVFPAAVNNPSYEHFRKALKGETVHIPAIEGLGGDDHTYQLYLVPIKDAAQNVSAVLWIHHDLGGEMKLVREQRRAAAIVNNIDALFIELDFEEKCLFINDTAEFYFGEKKEELIGKNIKDILPKDNIIGYNTVKKALTERVQAEVEYFCSLLQKWVFLSAVPSEDGVIILIYDRNDIKERS
jgi:PAS domain S-box-containing protein